MHNIFLVMHSGLQMLLLVNAVEMSVVCLEKSSWILGAYVDVLSSFSPTVHLCSAGNILMGHHVVFVRPVC